MKPLRKILAAAASALSAARRTFAEELRPNPIRRKVWWSGEVPVARLRQCRSNPELSAHLSRIGSELDGAVRTMLRTGATELKIHWVDMVSEENPYYGIGHFCVIGLKCDDPSVRAVNLQVRDEDMDAIRRLIDREMIRKSFGMPGELWFK